MKFVQVHQRNPARKENKRRLRGRRPRARGVRAAAPRLGHLAPATVLPANRHRGHGVRTPPPPGTPGQAAGPGPRVGHGHRWRSRFRPCTGSGAGLPEPGRRAHRGPCRSGDWGTEAAPPVITPPCLPPQTSPVWWPHGTTLSSGPLVGPPGACAQNVPCPHPPPPMARIWREQRLESEVITAERKVRLAGLPSL